MSKLEVTIDYIKIAQWSKTIRYLQDKILEELDRAVIDGGGKIPCDKIPCRRENKGRRESDK